MRAQNLKARKAIKENKKTKSIRNPPQIVLTKFRPSVYYRKFTVYDMVTLTNIGRNHIGTNDYKKKTQDRIYLKIINNNK